MSPLPQRKKSAEEIEKLRESLGVPSDSAAPGTLPRGVAPSAAAPPTTAPPEDKAPRPTHHKSSPAAPTPQKPTIQPVAPHDNRASADLPKKVIFSTFEAGAAGDTIPPVLETTPQAVDTSSQAETTPRLRLVRPSLKKSEQQPVNPRPPAPARDDSPLPNHRRSAEELEEMRKRSMMAMLNPPPPHPKLVPAHPAAITPGYLCCAGAASCFVFEGVPLAVAAGCAAGALIIALVICILRPVSKHHSGFIAAITLLIIVFGTLHYFPHLQHAT